MKIGFTRLAKMCTAININKRQKAADHVMEIENQDAFMCTGDIDAMADISICQHGMIKLTLSGDGFKDNKQK